MKKLLFAFVIALAYGTTALAVDIAISTQAGWWGQGAADQEMQDIVKNVKGASVQVFTVNDLAALANWVTAHTGDGVPDLLIMCGNFPETIYRSGNAQPNGSLAELFLDDGNTIINTGDYIFYVGTSGNNDAGGLQNMMDVPAAAMWGDDSLATTFVPTADGKLYTPSLPATPANRPWFPAQFAGTDWYFELILAQNSDGTQVHPGILRNRVTGGRLGVFFQVADQFTDIRGEVISEWINNWYLPKNAAPTVSANPSPADKATDVPRDAVLGWKATAYAGAHDVYLGTTFADVNSASRTDAKGVLAGKGQTDATFDPPGSLAYGQTYYWRVDEVNKTPDATIYKGGVWSFTVEPYGYPVKPVAVKASSAQPGMGPEKTIDGSGLNAVDQHGTSVTTMWMSMGAQPNWIQYEFDKVYKLHQLLVWNSNQPVETYIGFGAKKVTVETSTDGTTWTPLANVPEFSQATALPDYVANTTVNFRGVEAKFVKLTIGSNWGGVAPQAGLAEVRFSYVPVQARLPQPATGAKGVSVDATLDWRPGREAASHKVFFGTDQAAVTGATAPAQTVTGHGYAPGALNLATAYYWRVDEVNAAVTYPGDVWNFATQEYKVVEDFESYSDKTGAEVFSTWIDGFADNYKSSGSTVGLDTAAGGTFCETTIIRGGRQSMPLRYDNSKAPNFSEAVWTFDSPQDWTAGGIKSLSLWFQGVAGNGGQLYVKINAAKLVYDGPAADLTRPIWQPWNIELSKAGKVNSVRSLAIGVEGAGAQGTLYIDDISLYPKLPEYIVPVQPAATGLVAHYTFDEGSGTTVKDASGKGNNGTLGPEGTPKWVAGKFGGALQLDGNDDYVNIDALANDMPANNNFTVSAWIKTTTADVARLVVASNNDTGGHDFELGVAANGNLLVYANSSRSYPPKLSDDQWHMITYVRDGATAYVYIDGALVGTEIPTGNPATQTRWSIGQEWDPPSPSDEFLGTVDEVRIYARPLSAGEVAGLAGLTRTTAKPF